MTGCFPFPICGSTTPCCLDSLANSIALFWPLADLHLVQCVNLLGGSISLVRECVGHALCWPDRDTVLPLDHHRLLPFIICDQVVLHKSAAVTHLNAIIIFNFHVWCTCDCCTFIRRVFFRIPCILSLAGLRRTFLPVSSSRPTSGLRPLAASDKRYSRFAPLPHHTQFSGLSPRIARFIDGSVIAVQTKITVPPPTDSDAALRVQAWAWWVGDEPWDGQSTRLRDATTRASNTVGSNHGDTRCCT